MRRLLAYLARYRARYLFGCLCLIATASLAMSIPVLLKRAVDSIPGSGASPAPDGVRTAAFYALAIIGIAIVQGVVRSFSRFVIFNVGRDVEYDLRNDLFRHL